MPSFQSACMLMCFFQLLQYLLYMKINYNLLTLFVSASSQLFIECLSVSTVRRMYQPVCCLQCIFYYNRSSISCVFQPFGCVLACLQSVELCSCPLSVVHLCPFILPPPPPPAYSPPIVLSIVVFCLFVCLFLGGCINLFFCVSVWLLSDKGPDWLSGTVVYDKQALTSIVGSALYLIGI